MKLQRNNKYARRITAGLGALVVSLGILTGCNNTKEEVLEQLDYDFNSLLERVEKI